MNTGNTQYEEALKRKGIRYLAGVDEVGRGPLAGPFVAGAVVFDLYSLLHEIEHLRNNDVSDHKFNGSLLDINDSKKITEKRRTLLSKLIKSKCISFSISEIDNYRLDLLGISAATQEAFFIAISGLKVKPDFIVTDAFKIEKIHESYQMPIIRGDSRSITIAAASIIAKVYRDTFMINAHEIYPMYGFDKHKGYGTKHHIEAIREHGICPLHRKSFEPISAFI